MDISKLEQQAMKILGAGRKRKPKLQKKVNKPYRIGKNKKNKVLHAKLLAGHNMYLSTIDVEVAKFYFHEQTGDELILTPTKHKRIFKLSLS